MLEIRNIVKDYETGSETVHALKGVSIAFREINSGLLEETLFLLLIRVGK